MTTSLQDCKKPGRPPLQAKVALRRLFPEWSQRTFESYWRAWRIWADMRLDGLASEDDWCEWCRLSTRSTGSLNVSRLLRIAEVRSWPETFEDAGR